MVGPGRHSQILRTPACPWESHLDIGKRCCVFSCGSQQPAGHRDSLCHPLGKEPGPSAGGRESGCKARCGAVVLGKQTNFSDLAEPTPGRATASRPCPGPAFPLCGKSLLTKASPSGLLVPTGSSNRTGCQHLIFRNVLFVSTTPCHSHFSSDCSSTSSDNTE